MASLLTLLTLLAVLSGGLCQTRLFRSVLSVTNGGPWGTWATAEMCPENYYAIGFSLRVEGGQGNGDDTALNGIRLYCATQNGQGFVYTVESNSGFWGDWTTPQYCYNGVLTAFQLSVEAPIGSGDDTAANNINFRCSNNLILEGSGMGWGEYGGWSDTCNGGGICGIVTRVEAGQGDGDDTALNDVLFYCCDRTASYRSYKYTVSVSNGGPWGDWHTPEMCPENSFAIGFSQRVEHGQGDSGDDTALNGIRLYCAVENHESFMHTIESHPGFWGDWTPPQYCPGGVLTAFQLSVEAPIGQGDDTAANNIKFRCSSYTLLHGAGMPWGDYGAWSNTCSGGGICGIRTKIEGRQGEGDDTALNDVQFYCCALK